MEPVVVCNRFEGYFDYEPPRLVDPRFCCFVCFFQRLSNKLASRPIVSGV